MFLMSNLRYSICCKLNGLRDSLNHSQKEVLTYLVIYYTLSIPSPSSFGEVINSCKFNQGREHKCIANSNKPVHGSCISHFGEGIPSTDAQSCHCQNSCYSCKKIGSKNINKYQHGSTGIFFFFQKVLSLPPLATRKANKQKSSERKYCKVNYHKWLLYFFEVMTLKCFAFSFLFV